MIIQTNPNLHLTYCLNVHPGETWSKNFAAIREKTLAVHSRVGKKMDFGLGLRLGYRAARELSHPQCLLEFREFLEENRLYVFTINGFPYGRFHRSRVKEKVYCPDWRTVERRDYTIQLSNLLAALLPKGVSGSISTVPCSFRSWIRHPGEVERMVENFMDCVVHLDSLFKKTGKEIHLGLEPEPGCFLETTQDFICFFNAEIMRYGKKHLRSRLKYSGNQSEKVIRRHLGVCFDACHLSIQFEDLAGALDLFQAEGIRISKIQISAALESRTDAKSLRALKPFCEPVYLHQAVFKGANQNLKQSWIDLPQALEKFRCSPEKGDLRVHFHVPLFWEGSVHLGSTARYLTAEFFRRLKSGACPHLEIETYTFDVLPPELRADRVTKSIVKEYEWVMNKMAAAYDFTRASSC